MVLQLSRYRAGDSGQVKDDKVIPVPPGANGGIPFFDSGPCSCNKDNAVSVVFIICHLGQTLTPSHCTALSAPGSLMQV